MTQFLNDTFTGTPGTALEVYNPAWTRITGIAGNCAISADGSRARSTSTAGYYRADAPAPSADYSVTADLFIQALAGYAGLCGRVSSSAQTFYHARYLFGTGIQLIRYVNGAASTLGTFAYTPVAGETINLRLEMIGSSISVFVNGSTTPAIAVTDSNITEPGYVGMRFQNVSSAQQQIDNLVAETPEVAGGPTTTTVSPGAAGLTVTGYAPAITRTANQALMPAPVALTVRGYAPSIAQTRARAISPTPAALVVTGYVPTVTQTATRTVSPGVAALIVRGYAPTIIQAANVVPKVYAATFMRASVTSRTALMADTLNRAAELSSQAIADAVILTERTMSRSAELGPGAINRTVSIP